MAKDVKLRSAKAKSTRHAKIDLGLFENALDFISSSLNSILNNESDSAIKYSILHLHAGVELILKKLLMDEHWSLIFQNVDKADKKQLDTGDFISVSSKTAIDRLNNICGISLDKRALESLEDLRKKRNIIEHYAFHSNEVALKSIVSEVLIVVLNLVEEYISHDKIKGLAKENLQDIREKSLKFKEFTEKKIQSLQPKLGKLGKEFEILTCPNCFQETFVLDENFECLFCKYSDSPEKVVSLYIENVLKISRFYEESEGGYFPLEDCPDCENHTLLIRDNNSICFSCLRKWDNRTLDNCSRCNRLFVGGEEEGSLCKQCWSDVINSGD